MISRQAPRFGLQGRKANGCAIAHKYGHFTDAELFVRPHSTPLGVAL
jgi:hypothetical protein